MSEERKREKESLLYFKYHFRIILIGDSNTGKTTICNTLLDRNNPHMQYQPTIGIDLNVINMELYNDTNIKIQLWDTAGQEVYRSIINSYYRNTCGVILTYNITDRRSFFSLDNWLNDINKFNCCKHYYKHPILLLGTNRDKENKRQVSYKEGYDYARHNNLIFREVVSFNKQGPLDDGILEFLRSIYALTDKNRENIESKIPLALPIKKKIKKDCKIAIAEECCDDLIICKGVKYIQKPIDFENNLDFSDGDLDETNKFCGKCV